jgi:hypothetical protein
VLHDNWWALTGGNTPIRRPEPGTGEPKHEALRDLYSGPEFGPRDFLPENERSQGESEWKQILQRGGNGVDFLCAETISWARAHAQDSRVPEALHLCVMATRYGPTDDHSGAFSKQAFDLLHRQYPNSEWTKQTKYWY